MKSYPMVQTPRLKLRQFVNLDAKRVRELAGDKAIADTTKAVPHPYLEGLAEVWISGHSRCFEERKSLALAVVEKSSSELVGCISLKFSNDFKSAEMGYWIGVPYWNAGFCTEAARALVAYAFENLKLQTITAHHLARNPASGRVMEKIGMSVVGRLTSDTRCCGTFEEQVGYGISNRQESKPCLSF